MYNAEFGILNLPVQFYIADPGLAEASKPTFTEFK